MNGFYGKILSPTEVVDYSGMIINNYQRRSRDGSIMNTPFVGFKILMRDGDAFKGPSPERIRFLETFTPRVLSGSGCFLRETNNSIMPDGYWLVTSPVPITQLNDYENNQMNRILSVVKHLESSFNFVRQGRCEINVSGRCTVAETEARLRNVYIPEDLKRLHMTTEGSAYTLGSVLRINHKYALVRSSWNFSSLTDQGMKDVLLQMTYNISGMYR